MNRLQSLSAQVLGLSPKILSTFGEKGQLLIQFNNPSVLNAIDTSMYNQMAAIAQDPANKVLIVRGVGKKAFSCGGDVKGLYRYIAEKDDQALQKYFDAEFQMDLSFYYMSQQSSTLHIALFNGISIGGALPINLFAKIRVCTENTAFSIPECKNGLTVPGLKFFADMKHNLGVYLAMTGDFVRGEDCLRFGLVEYFVEDRFLETLQNELLTLTDEESCRNAVKKYAKQIDSDLGKKRDYIQRLFELTTFEKFWSKINYEAEHSTDKDLKEFAKYSLAQMNASSKIALRVNYELLLSCRKEWPSLEALILDQVKAQFNITQLSKDCLEGLKKAVISKNYIPKWEHDSPLAVSDKEIDSILNYEDHRIKQSEVALKIVKQQMSLKKQLSESINAAIQVELPIK